MNPAEKTIDEREIPHVNSYEPPTIELLEISVEKGFADSAAGWEEGAW